jgi:small subunit ribosomal protein S1
LISTQIGRCYFIEFRYNPALKVGDTVEVLIDIREDKTGQLVYLRKARTSNHGIELFYETGEIVNGLCAELKCV